MTVDVDELCGGGLVIGEVGVGQAWGATSVRSSNSLCRVSELSDSFHLRTNDSADAVALLRAARVPGSVFPAENGWVSFVFERGMRIGTNDLADRVFAANKGLLVDNAYAADHGCWVSVYRGPERVARLKVSFETPSRSFDRESPSRSGRAAPPEVTQEALACGSGPRPVPHASAGEIR